MKRILTYVAILIVGVVGGVALLMFGPLKTLLPSKNGTAKAAAVTQPVPSFASAKAVDVTETNVESNLANSSHYINFTVSFGVMPAALKTAIGKPAGGSSGGSSGGTGSPVLDARIRNNLINLCRSTSYSALQSSGGLSTFKAEVTVQLEAIFGAGTVGNVYFPNLVTQ